MRGGEGWDGVAVGMGWGWGEGEICTPRTMMRWKEGGGEMDGGWESGWEGDGLALGGLGPFFVPLRCPIATDFCLGCALYFSCVASPEEIAPGKRDNINVSIQRGEPEDQALLVHFFFLGGGTAGTVRWPHGVYRRIGG